MDNDPAHSPAPDKKKLWTDDDPLPAELQAQFPEVVRQHEKGVDAKSISDEAPEAIVLGHGADKEVAHGADALSPQVVANDSPLYHVQDNNSNRDGNGDGATPDADHESKRKDRRICGLPKMTFWTIVLVVCVLIVGVAIGAGVGTAVARKSKPSNASGNPAAESTSPSPNSSSPSSSTATSTSSAPEPSSTLQDYRDIKYNFTAWEHANYTGRWQFMDRAGYYKLAFTAVSIYWKCGTWTDTERCSVGYCNGTDDWVGWKGGLDHPLPMFTAKAPNRVKILCGGIFEDPGCNPLSPTTTPPVFAATVSAPTVPTPEPTSDLKRAA